MQKKVIGITGGIGCGKSVVMSLLEEKYKAAVLLSDLIAHDLMKPGEANYKAILETFGQELVDETGEIDRKKLGTVVFSDAAKLKVLNQVTHPNIIEETKRRIEANRQNKDVDFICLESALLLDTDLVFLCDEVWYIYADREIRIERLMEGRGYTREHCLSVMAKQMPEDQFREKADEVIDNSGSVEATEAQILQLLKKTKFS